MWSRGGRLLDEKSPARSWAFSGSYAVPLAAELLTTRY